jgi:hypothetical protein
MRGEWARGTGHGSRDAREGIRDMDQGPWPRDMSWCIGVAAMWTLWWIGVCARVDRIHVETTGQADDRDQVEPDEPRVGVVDSGTSHPQRERCVASLRSQRS